MRIRILQETRYFAPKIRLLDRTLSQDNPFAASTPKKRKVGLPAKRTGLRPAQANLIIDKLAADSLNPDLTLEQQSLITDMIVKLDRAANKRR